MKLRATIENLYIKFHLNLEPVNKFYINGYLSKNAQFFKMFYIFCDICAKNLL